MVCANFAHTKDLLIEIQKSFCNFAEKKKNNTMASMTMTFDLPETQDIDLVALKKQMQAFFKMVLSMPNIHKAEPKTAEEKDDIHIFDCFSGDFGGDRDANEIADEIHDSRIFTRSIEPW